MLLTRYPSTKNPAPATVTTSHWNRSALSNFFISSLRLKEAICSSCVNENSSERDIGQGNPHARGHVADHSPSLSTDYTCRAYTNEQYALAELCQGPAHSLFLLSRESKDHDSHAELYDAKIEDDCIEDNCEGKWTAEAGQRKCDSEL